VPAQDETATNVSHQQLVALLTQSKFWPPSLSDLETQLKPLGPLKHERPAERSLQLIGGATGVVQRSDISYASDGHDNWVFESASFFVSSSDLEQTNSDLERLLRKQLGKPNWSRRDSPKTLKSSSWRLTKKLWLILAPSYADQNKLLELTIADTSGD
jgi:hypothetical protein